MRRLEEPSEGYRPAENIDFAPRQGYTWDIVALTKRDPAAYGAGAQQGCGLIW